MFPRAIGVVVVFGLLSAAAPNAFAQWSFPFLELNRALEELGGLQSQVQEEIGGQFEEMGFANPFGEPEEPAPDPEPEPDPEPQPGPFIEPGTLTISDAGTLPDELLVTTGNEYDVVALTLAATDEDFVVDTLSFITSPDIAASSGKATLQYDGLTAEGFFADNGSLTLTALGMLVPKDGVLDATLSLAFPQGATTDVEGVVGFDASGTFKATGQASGAVDEKADNFFGTVKQEQDVTGPQLLIRNSIVYISASELPSTTLIPGENILSAFTVTADSGGSVALFKLSWDFLFGAADNISTMSLSHFLVYTSTDPTNPIRVDSSLFRRQNSEGSLSLHFAEEEVIQAGESQTFYLAATVSGQQPGESIATSLAGADDTPVFGYAESVAANNSFVWSDMSGDPHEGYDSADWLSGAGVPGLPTQFQTVF